MILVFGEEFERDVTYELVALAKRLGDYKVVVSEDFDDIDGDVIRVERLNWKVVKELHDRFKPEGVLFANAPSGMDLAPKLAGITGIPMVTNVIKLENGDRFKATSLTYGGKVLVDLEVDKPSIFVVNRGYYDPNEGRGTPKVEKLDLDFEDDVELIEVVKPEEDVDISKAEVVVSVGRGIGDESNIELAKELAELLNGVVAGSRPIIDQGWLPKSRQVGRSGKTVTGKVYIALGISGATEHVEGVKAKNVIAVNTDRDAPIFRIAKVGVVADVNELLPVLIEKLREIKS